MPTHGVSAAGAATTTSMHVDTRNGGVVPVPVGGSKEKVSSPVNVYSPTSAEAPFSPVVPTHHMNAAVLNGVTYPSARAATIAKEAVDAAQMYYKLFFQANEEAAWSGNAPSGGQVSAFSAPAASTSSSSPHHHQQQQQHSHPQTSSSGKPHRTTQASTDDAAERKMRPVVSQDDVSVRSDHHSSSTGSGLRLRDTSKEASLRVSRTSSVHSNEASSMSVQTPVNVVDTAYHTFFPPVLSSVKREDIVERIVSHRPRPYRQWVWHKAEDYHALHAQNVHHNNVYHEYPPNVAVGTAGGGVGEATVAGNSTASPVASQANGQPAVVTPLSTSPSYPTMSPVARVAGWNGSRASTEGDSGASPTGAATPKPSGSSRGFDRSTSAGSAEEVSIHTVTNGGSASVSGSTSTGVAASAVTAPVTLPKVPSFLLNEMPFELMSQLSMYTIPTSQQGPEYFKKTAEDGTKTLIIFMMGLPARGKTFLAQKICRLLGWHGSRAKVQNIQVAWRRVLLDWEATHADQLAEERRRHGGESSSGPDSDSGHPAKAATAATTTTRPPTPNAATATTTTASTTTTVRVPDINLARSRAQHALSGQHPSHSSTQDEVSRVVRDLATGMLGTTQRRAADGAFRPAQANATAAKMSPTGKAGEARGLPASSSTAANANLSAAVTQGLLSLQHSPAAQPLEGDGAAAVSPVCPSMEPFTAVSRDGTAVFSATPSPTAAASDFASDVAVAGSPLDAALHSQPLSPTATGASAGFAFNKDNEGPAGVEDTASAGTAGSRTPPPSGSGTDRPAMPAEVLRTRHFKDLIQNQSSVARRLYRYVLQSFADDCRLFFQHGGEVVVINDDFVTEELRQEAEKLFRPLATQFFYMEVIRDAEEDPLDFVQCKIRDPMEYPRGDIDLRSATDDFNERLQFLEEVYETLEEAPKTKTEERVRAAAREKAAAQQQDQEQEKEGETERHRSNTRVVRQQQQQPQRSYVKIRNANAIETHGISGYLASRIISYVMNLSQVKIQHPIYFVRHGESCYNLEDRIGGNPLLTEQGMRDAGALLEFLASLKHHLKHVDHVQRAQPAGQVPPQHQPQHESLHEHDDPAAYTTSMAPNTGPNHANTLEIWTSQLRRAIQTAELSERLLNIRTLRWSSLNEIHAGVCEDMTYEEVTQRYPLIDYFRKRSKYTFRYPEGESYQDLVVRLEPVIMELENADKVVVVVAHQAVLRCLLAYFGSTSAESSISVEVPHRTVWRCTYDSKGIASLDELKLDNYEAGFQLRKAEPAAAAQDKTPSEASTMPPSVEGV